ncbi:monovalent cation:proton antiporter family protein [Crocinitomix algicola]|uniref:monovalent cation:proton antiporter family protein n=1 Tax=Crocinitomix algicola TaxID=1740263 RepID=UPI00082F77BE|nr:monovalent cation:proton antiporter family protein [Crocinitomix algicola]
MHLPILPDIVIILGLSVFTILIFQKIKLPAILGFLITGIIVGPYGLNLIEAKHEVEVLSEIGIIFLLFVIGIEFSLKGLASIKNTVLIGGGVQVIGTIGLVTFLAYELGLSIQSAVFMGFLISLSSTAIVLKMLQEKGELISPHGRVAVAILIFQDIIVVLMMLLTPILAGQSDDPMNELLWLLIKMIAVVAAIIILARYAVPVLLKLVVRAKSRELFILTTIVLCFSTAWLTSSVGLSLALGAFFAGLVISESEYSHQATANILPFREIFISFFFVSVGMLLDLNFFIENIVYIHLLAIAVIGLKLMVVIIAVLLLKYQLRTSLLTGLALLQVGEFAFLLSTVGMQYDLLSETVYQYFLAISIISMGATPFIINWSPQLTHYLLRTPLPPKVRERLKMNAKKKELEEKNTTENFHDHVVIIGYGLNGQNVAKAARKANIPYVIIEIDPQAIKKAKDKGEPVVFGDATDTVILKHVHIQEARVVVVAISAHDATRSIVKTVRLFTETAHIIVRTRYIKEVDEIIKIGADEVIPEEFETSIEIFTRVMKKYLIPNDEIEEFITDIRSYNYEAFRSIPNIPNGVSTFQVHIPDMEIAAIHVLQGKNSIVGHTIFETGLRKNYNVTVLAIKRDSSYILEINEDTKVIQDDIIYLFGSPDDIIKVNKYFVYK